jgi:peptide/nickel transport system substrate-binding protein
LLKAVPFDRITLVDNSVVEVEPISPRPLPPYDPAKDDTKASDTPKTKAEAPREGNVALPAKKATKGSGKKKKDEEPQINEIVIHRLEGDVRDFKLRRAVIKNVEYYEDMLMAEAERLVQIREYARAFEYLLAIKLRNPSWKGLEDHVQQLLFEEGTWALTYDKERGLRLLRELHERKPDYPELADKLAEAYGGRIDRAFKLGAYREARRILHELEGLAPKHILVGESRARFQTLAKQLADEAGRAEGPDRLDKLVETLRIWPTQEGAAETYAQAFAEQPTLDVGVLDVPRPIGPWRRMPASGRVNRLIYRPILANEEEDALKGKPAEQIAAGVDVTDLGKRLVIRLREGVPWSDGTRDLAAFDLVRSLSDRAETTSPAYSARWADLLDRVEAIDENQVEVRLSRAPLKPEAWLLGPVGPAHAGWDGWVAIPGKGRRPVGDGLFAWERGSDQLADYRAGGPGSAAGAKVRRIREIRLPTATAALGALLRGEVSLLEHVPPDRLAGLAEDQEIKVGRYTRPVLHRIAFDGRNPLLRSRSLRRGLCAAIDRKAILEETLLRRPTDAANAPSDGPFQSDSYANAPDVKPYVYDPLVARMLVAAARKELGVPLRLTLEYPALPEAQLAVPKIVEEFKAAGLEVKAVERSESELEEGLRAGRRFDMVYRASPCTEPAFDVGPLLCPGYDAPPATNSLATLASPRILQLLLELEHAPEWPSARATLLQIDRECRDELPVLPLWQLEDHYAWRTRLKGPGETAEHLYQGIDGWEIAPWYYKDPW